MIDADVLIWGEGIGAAGLLALHDSTGTWTDPTRVADELAASADWTELESCAYTRVFRKDSREA